MESCRHLFPHTKDTLLLLPSYLWPVDIVGFKNQTPDAKARVDLHLIVHACVEFEKKKNETAFRAALDRWKSTDACASDNRLDFQLDGYSDADIGKIARHFENSSVFCRGCMRSGHQLGSGYKLQRGFIDRTMCQSCAKEIYRLRKKSTPNPEAEFDNYCERRFRTTPFGALRRKIKEALKNSPSMNSGADSRHHRC